jgi:hypothetical protein
MSEKGNIGDGNSINPDPDSVILNDLRTRPKQNNQSIRKVRILPPFAIYARESFDPSSPDSKRDFFS